MTSGEASRAQLVGTDLAEKLPISATCYGYVSWLTMTPDAHQTMILRNRSRGSRAWPT